MTEPADPSQPAAPAAATSLPYTAVVNDTAADLVDRFGTLEPGIETGQQASVAGRLMLRRVQGKLAFGTLADHTGRIQLFAPSQTTPEFEAFTGLSLGDWIVVSGEVIYHDGEPTRALPGRLVRGPQAAP